MAKFNVTGEQDLNIDKQMIEIKRQIRQKGGSPIDPKLVALTLQDIVEGKFAHSKEEDFFLRLLSKGEVIIDACDGTETFANAQEVFSCIDGDFKYPPENRRPGVATKDTQAQVYEMVKNSTFAKMFVSFGVDLGKLCFTQHQIKNFCKRHSNWLSKNGDTFFLYKARDRFFIAGVYMRSDGLGVARYHFDRDYTWCAGKEKDLRVVFPERN